MIGLLGIGFAIGIPVIAIVALVRSGAAERRIDETWYKISNLQGEISGLRRELTGLSNRVNELEISAVRPLAGDRQVGQNSAPVEASIEPGVAAEDNVAPVQPAQPAAASSWLDQTIVQPHSSPKSVPTPVTSFGTKEQPAPAGITAFEVRAERVVVKETDPAPNLSDTDSPHSATPPTYDAAVSPPIPSLAAYKPAAPKESVFRRLMTNLPLEQLLGMNLFAKVGINRFGVAA